MELCFLTFFTLVVVYKKLSLNADLGAAVDCARWQAGKGNTSGLDT